MAANATATAEKLTAEPPKEAIKPLHPSALTLNYAGFAWSEYLLRLPESWSIATLIENPSAWSTIQGGLNGSLKRFDKVLVTTFAEDAAAETFVQEASDSAVVLAPPARIVGMQSRTLESAYTSEKYTMRWCGIGWGTVRNDTGAIVVPPQASRQIAIQEHKRLYPSRALA